MEKRKEKIRGREKANRSVHFFRISVLLLLLSLPAGCSYGSEAQKHPDRPNEQAGAVVLKKMSPALARTYNREDPGKQVSVLVVTVVPLSPDRRKELGDHGINVGTVSGRVFTADMQLKALPFLIGRPYVRSVELSKRLHLLDQEK